jgi:histidine triad (HIT) family protein
LEEVRVYNHAPKNYICPFCRIVQESVAGENNEMVYRDEAVTAFMSLQDPPNNLGHVAVISNGHYENIYDLPVSIGARIQECSRVIAIAMKAAYHCDGITLRQNNEPAGGQDVWHYHLHVYPRYEGDNFPRVEKIVTPMEKRIEFAERLREYLVNHA